MHPNSPNGCVGFAKAPFDGALLNPVERDPLPITSVPTAQQRRLRMVQQPHAAGNTKTFPAQSGHKQHSCQGSLTLLEVASKGQQHSRY